MSRWRRIGAAVVLLLSTGCSIFGEEEALADIARDQTFAPSGPRPVADAGPAPGILRESWRIDGLGKEKDAREIRLAGGQLFVAGADGLEAHDAGTGAKRWRYREPGRDLIGYAVSKDALVIATRPSTGQSSTGQSGSTRSDADIRLTGLAAGTGRLLWERSGAEATPFTSQQGLALAIGEGVVPLLAEAPRSGDDDKPDEFIALDAATGERRWRREHRAPGGCDYPQRRATTDTDGSVVVFQESCRSEHYVYAFDPATGTPLWSRRGTSRLGAETSVRNGATLIGLDKGTRVIVGRDGRDLARMDGAVQCVTPCSLQSMGDDLGLIHLDGSNNLVVSLINRSSGQVRTVDTPDDGLPAVGGGRVYSVRPHLDRGTLLPAGLTVLDPATAALTTMPLPLSLPSGRPRWAGATGGQLLVATTATESLVAYAATPAQGPVELGGVRPEDWPQACDLLKDLPGKVAAHTPTVKGPVRAGTRELARSACGVTYTVGGIERGARAEVLWVSASPAEADGLLDGEPGRYGADEARKTDGESIQVRKGRYIVEVQADQPDDLERIVGGVLKSLN